MPVITTKIMGDNEADPKPVRGVNYAGLPMKPGDFYNGRPEHQAPNVLGTEPTHSVKRKRSAYDKRKSPEFKKQFSDRMRAYWAQRKAQRTNPNASAI
jgi:hypothetical protein